MTISVLQGDDEVASEAERCAKRTEKLDAGPEEKKLKSKNLIRKINKRFEFVLWLEIASSVD